MGKTAIERWAALFPLDIEPDDAIVTVPVEWGFVVGDVRLAADCIAFVKDVLEEINMVRSDGLVNRCHALNERIKEASDG